MKIFIGVLLTVLSSSPLLAESITTSDRVVNGVIIRTEVNSTSSSISKLLPGQTAELLDKASRYYKVQHPDGYIGYVSKNWTVLNEGLNLPKLVMHFMNVGQGDATLINCPNGNNILIDMGSSSSSSSAVLGELSKIKEYFDDSLTITKELQSFIITHPDKDHYVLADDVIAQTPVRNIFFVGDEVDYNADSVNSAGSVFSTWFRAQTGNKVKPLEDKYDNEITPNEMIDCGSADIHILAAMTPPKPGWKTNAKSIIIMVRYKNFEAVITGDATFSGENKVMSRFDKDWLNVDLLQFRSPW